VPRKSSSSSQRLAPLTEIGDPSRYGPSLVQLAKLALDGVPVLSTAAFSSSVFRALVDKQQRSEHSLAALLKQAHKRGHRARCHAAARFVHTSELDPELIESALSFTRALAAGADTSLWVWTSFVAAGELTPDTRFGLPSQLHPDDLATSLRRAFQSAYDPDLVREAALAGIKAYSVAVALSVLPPNAVLGELWLAAGTEADATSGERDPQRPATAMRGRLRGHAIGDGPVQWFWFDGDLHFDGREFPDAKPPLAALSRLRASVPPGSSLDFSVAGQLAVAALTAGNPLSPTSSRPATSSRPVSSQRADQAQRPVERGRWVPLQDDRRPLPSEVSLSLLEQVLEDGVRPQFEQASCPLGRRDKLIEPAHGQLCLDTHALTQAIAKGFLPESRWLSELFGQPASEKPARDEDPRFVLPRLFAALTVSETKLRTSLREFEAEAHEHRRWLQELDLSILPNDGLRNTLRETAGFVKRTVQLYLQAKFGMVRALTALTSLARLSDDRRPLERVFTALRGLGDVASTVPYLEAVELSRTVARDPDTQHALLSGVTALADLPQGIATAEITRFLARHGDQPTQAWDLSAPHWEERPETLLRILALTTSAGPPRSQRPAPRASQRPEATAAQMVDRIASASGWLEKRAIVALLARAAGFIRVHEQLRVWLGRCTGLVRKVLLDADRRVQRWDASLPAGVVWASGLDDIALALAGDPGRLQANASFHPVRAAASSARGGDPAWCVPPGLHSLPTRLAGSFTGTGSFTGSVLRLDSLDRPGRSITKDDVLVCTSFDSWTCMAAAHAGALLAELGGPLSLPAVVARELGIPTVLGLGPGLSLFENGERVFVDGDRGIVERQSRG